MQPTNNQLFKRNINIKTQKSKKIIYNLIYFLYICAVKNISVAADIF